MKMFLIIIEIIITLMGVALGKSFPKTYDLLRYSHVSIVKTVSKVEENQCKEIGLNYECSPLDNASDNSKENIWRYEASWKAFFNEHTKEVKLKVHFPRTYIINNLLLSFKEAKNISALSIEIKSNSKTVNLAQYAVSNLLCEFFFPTDSYSSLCIIKADLSDGVIIHHKVPVKGDQIIIHLFPPIVDSYDRIYFYSINQLFIGGSCYCDEGHATACHITLEDDLSKNDGTRYVLVCGVDMQQTIQNRLGKLRRRREACPCSPSGTLYGLCKPFIGVTQQCPCKPNFIGMTCDKCGIGYFAYPRCITCNCDYVGSISSTCNITSGQCKCEPRYSGLKCNQCASGRFDFPFCYPCPCEKERTLPKICHSTSGKCLCLERYDGAKCTSCRKSYKNYPICHRPGCKCSKPGALDGTCNDQMQCKCRETYAGEKCDICASGFGSYPSCTACHCDPFGSKALNCNIKTGQCICKAGFAGKRCNECARSIMTYPHCNVRDRCICDVHGTRQAVKTNGRCILGYSCLCKRNVMGNRCSQCKHNSFNLSASNAGGCINCKCSEDGSFGHLSTCDEKTGQCVCKPNVEGKACDRCREGFHLMDRWNLLGCSPCNCDVGGSVSLNCNEQGNCECKKNFEGKTCNQLRKGPFFVSQYYHLMFEVEKSILAGKPVIYRYYSTEFMNFTGRGYFAFGQKQSNIKLLLNVPKTRKYLLIVRYYFKQEDETTMLVNLQSNDKETSYAAVVDFERFDITLSIPSYALVLRSDGEREFMLTKGIWNMGMSSISSFLLVDHVVIIPQEYYTGDTLQPNDIAACVAGQTQGSICMMYKYISLQHFQLLQAERGTNSRGYGNAPIKRTNIYKDPDLLQQLPIMNEMAELSREQIALTLEVSVHTTDTYYVVVTYFNPDERTYRLDMYDGHSGKRGQVEVVPCLYQFLCRLVVHHSDGMPFPFEYFSNKTSAITFLGNIRGSLAIDYVALIPASKWSADYIIPSKLCYKRGRVCLQNIEFQTPEDVIKVDPSDENPVNSLTNTVHATSERVVVFIAPTVKSVNYFLICQFYQPNLPYFFMDVKLSVQGTIKSSEIVKVPHCIANSGCRQVLLEFNAINSVLDGPVTITLKVPKAKELWIDSMFLISSSSFSQDILVPKRLELTRRFQRECLNQNTLPLLNPPEDFCMQALVTLTSEFTNKTFECNCDKRGALLLACDKIGGQCKCKRNVVGRDCSRCKTGDYNFPFCKACNCFIPGSVSADCNKYGHCKCKPNYTGWRCDRCQKKQWGFPICRACDCDASGSFSLTCRRADGQCSCLKSFSGRKCNQCEVGYFDFPDCRSCNCNPAGIRITEDSPTGCFKSDRNRCDCKQNVEGHECDVCKTYFYGLNVNNPLGCNPCNCSSFGTVRGSGPCNTETGKCLCHPNLVGKDCSTCKDGFYVVKTDHVFSCQPCQCSPGGSLHEVCDKLTGHCKCKAHITGTKCEELASGGYYLPSIWKYIFDGKNVSPRSPRGDIKGLHGTFVNSSYASVRMSFNILEQESYYLLISYALVDKKNALIDIEFTNDASFVYLTHKLKTKKLNIPVGEIVKEDNSYLVLNFSKGLWHMQSLFQETIFLNQISLVPAEHFSAYRISRRIRNPCTVKDSRRFCAMYTYYDLTKANATIYEAESLTRENLEYFDLKTYTGANINGAIALKKNEYLFTSKDIHLKEQYYIIVQYLNIESEALTLEVNLRFNSNSTSQKGSVELYPCSYAFACRQVVLSVDGRKLAYNQGGGKTYIMLKVITGKAVYIDLISLVPVLKWTSNILTPSLYCIRRFSRCIDGSFPSTTNMFKLETKTSRGVSLLNSSPPESQPPSVSVLLTRYQRNLRWMSPMKVGGYYLIIHYYQPLVDSFYSKVILTTYQRAVAGKVNFKYCPSIYGCRSVVHYLEENIEQRFVIKGNIVRAIFSVPYNVKLWVESLIFINPLEYAEHKNILEINPLDLTKKYVRRCAGKKPNQVAKNIRSFCMSSMFELKLGLGTNPKPCKCHPRGTVRSIQCDPYDGHCTCKGGFLGRDCSSCVEGTFPNCKPRRIIINTT